MSHNPPRQFIYAALACWEQSLFTRRYEKEREEGEEREESEEKES
jgi:hypothetical protein